MGQNWGKYELNQQLVTTICSNNKIDEQNLKQNIEFLNANQYQIVRFLGKGQFGVVLQAYSSKYGNVAIKIIRFEEDANEIKKEINSLEKIKDKKYLTKTYECLISENLKTFYIVHELCSCTLDEILELNILTESQIYSITKHLLQGLIELKAQNIVHCDIKPDNILYNSENNVFIFADFGLSKIIKPDQSHITSNTVIGGTIKYMAPEVGENNQKKTNKIDIFSLGVTLAEIVRGEKFDGFKQFFEIKIDKIQNHLPQNSLYQKYIDLIVLNMAREYQSDRMEPSQLLELLEQNFQFNECDLKSLKVKNNNVKQYFI